MDKMIVKGRVKSAGLPKTPVAGAPQAKDTNMKGTRVTLKSEMPRKNDAPMTAANRMGLNMSGTRVTSKQTRKR